MKIFRPAVPLLALAGALLVSCKPAPESAPPSPTPAEPSATSAADSYFGRIEGMLTRPVSGPAPKFVALYFSAQWCPPCRMFTPKLVEWYKEFKPAHPDFELVFVSADRDEAAMQQYMAEDGMPWPAASFDQRENEIFRQFASDGIPYLVLLDAQGKPLTAKPGNEWQSPEAVLQEIERLVPSGS